MEEYENITEKLYITFHSQDEIAKFVETCCCYDDAIDIKRDKQITDAKSIVGMMLLPIEKSLEIIYECFDESNDYVAFKENIIGKFDVKIKG